MSFLKFFVSLVIISWLVYYFYMKWKNRS
jgi:hypothetical protein